MPAMRTRILTAAKAAMTALALDGIKGVYVREWQRGTSHERYPALVVSVGQEPATEYLTAVQKLKTYTVSVAIIAPNVPKYADDAAVWAWREAIEGELDKRATWAGVTGFNEVSVTNRPPADAAVIQKGQNYSMVTADVTVLEPRT